MTPSAIYRKVMIFNWIKLGIGFLNCLVAMLIIGGTYLLITYSQLDITTDIAIGCGAFLLIVAIYYVMMGRLGYSVRTGQLAVTERANAGQAIPPNPVEFSKDIVSQRFGSNRRFYLISRDIVIAIRQFVRVFARGFSLVSDTPDLRLSRRLLILFSHSAIFKADDCCIAYALRKRDYELNAACVDALTILAQQWGTFIRRAFKLSLIVTVSSILLFFIFYLPGLAVSRSLSVSSFPWMGISFLLMISFKIAFFDTWVQTKMVCEFLDIASHTTIDGQLYQKLDSWSSMYANLRKAAQKATEMAEKAEKSGKTAHELSSEMEREDESQGQNDENDEKGKDERENDSGSSEGEDLKEGEDIMDGNASAADMEQKKS